MRSFEVTIISVVKFLITCFVSDILKDIKYKDNSNLPSWLFKKSMTSQQGKILLLIKQLANTFNIKIHLDFYL